MGFCKHDFKPRAATEGRPYSTFSRILVFVNEGNIQDIATRLRRFALLQLLEFPLRLDQDRYVLIRFLPEREEILIRLARLSGITLHH